ncbi:MAG: PadR family transcriptional regulator [Nanoarchaeota archaeon]
MVKVDSLVKLHTLISLNNSEKHGYELMKELSSKLDKKISSSNVYPFLKELKENYYVNVRQLGREKIYHLTANGNKFVNETLLRFNEVLQESLKRKITKCTHCGCEVYNSKYNEIINGKKLAFCCCHCADSYKKGIKHGHD